jgi:alkyl hydroperoxide reductase subunit AhpF
MMIAVVPDNLITLPVGRLMEKIMSSLLNKDIVQQVREIFHKLQHPVHILFFEQKAKCGYCNETRQLVEEVVAISDKLSMNLYDLDANRDVAQKFNVDKVPVIVVSAKNGDQIIDLGIRYAGVPSGHEFTSFIQGILLVATRDSGLNEQTRTFLSKLETGPYAGIRHPNLTVLSAGRGACTSNGDGESTYPI